MLLFKSGYYSNHVSLCMSTLNQAYVLTCILNIRILFKTGFYSKQDSIQNRILFKTGFYSKQDSIQNRLLFKTGLYSKQDSIQHRILFKTGFYSKQDSIQNRILFKTGFFRLFSAWTCLAENLLRPKFRFAGFSVTGYTGGSSTDRKFDAAEMCFSPGRRKFECGENLSPSSSVSTSMKCTVKRVTLQQ